MGAAARYAVVVCARIAKDPGSKAAEVGNCKYIKCNSQQSRLQCSFNEFQRFIRENPSKVITKSNTNNFRGGMITSEITSSRRRFNKPKETV